MLNISDDASNNAIPLASKVRYKLVLKPIVGRSRYRGEKETHP